MRNLQEIQKIKIQIKYPTTYLDIHMSDEKQNHSRDEQDRRFDVDPVKQFVVYSFKYIIEW